MLPVVWKQDYTLTFKSTLLKNIKSVEAGAEVYSFPFTKKKDSRTIDWLILLKTN